MNHQNKKQNGLVKCFANLLSINYNVDNPDSYYGNKAQNYNAVRHKQFRWQLEQQIVEEIVKKQNDGITVLDVPFGTGRFVDFYISKNIKIHGLDISKDMIQQAEKNLGDKFEWCVVKTGNAKIYHILMNFLILLFQPDFLVICLMTWQEV